MNMKKSKIIKKMNLYLKFVGENKIIFTSFYEQFNIKKITINFFLLIYFILTNYTLLNDIKYNINFFAFIYKCKLFIYPIYYL